MDHISLQSETMDLDVDHDIVITLYYIASYTWYVTRWSFIVLSFNKVI